VSTLAIHPGALGDVLLAVPALRALKSAHQGEPLVLGAQPRVGALMAALRIVDQAVPFDALRLDTLFVEDDAATPSDAVRRGQRVICWFGARDPVFTRRLRALVPGALVASASGDGADPVWRHLLTTVDAVPDGSPAPCDLLPEARQAGRDALVRAGWRTGTRLVVAHPGAGGRGKRWSVEGFAQVLAPLGARPDLTVVLHEGPADADAAAALSARLGRGARLLRGLSLVELAGALAQAAAYLGNDSGVSHLAAALGVPSVILFEQRSLAWRPWSASVDVVVVDPGAPVAQADVATVAARLARSVD
jgi:heptosyltransferase III